MTEIRKRPLSVVAIGMTWQDERPGGLNRYLGDLHAALRRKGVRSQVVVAGALPNDPVAGVHRVAGSLPRRLLNLRREIGRLSLEADVVHSHFALHALLPVLMSPARRRPLVTSFQGPWADEARTEGDLSALRHFARHRIEQAVYRRSTALVCLSTAFAHVLIRGYGVPPWRVHVVAPGVDLDHFSVRDRGDCRRRLGLPEDVRVVLSVRRLAERMGLDVLLQAWARLPYGLLLLAGDGPARDRLHALASELDLGVDRVRFLGRVAEDELPLLYGAADLSVVPTTELEGFGLVVLESLAVGTPVIASAEGGLTEVLPTLQKDLLVETGSPQALAERLGSAFDGSRPLPDRAVCRSFAERFSWERTATRFSELYEEVQTGMRSDRIRVVYLLSTAQPSGGELALLRVLRAASSQIDAHVVLAERGPVCSLLDDEGITWEVVPLAAAGTVRRGAAASRIGALTAAVRFATHGVRLARRLRQLEPDIVHANSLKAGVYGGIATRLAGHRFVWHVRDRLSDDYLPARAAASLRRAVGTLPHGVVANSDVTMSTLQVRRHQTAAVVASPVDRPVDFALRPSDGPLRVVSVGRLAPWKGQDVLLRAFATAFPDGDERLEVIGGALFGEDKYAAELVRLTADLGLADRVTFLGHCPDVWERLADVDVLVHSAVLPEPHGNVVAEGLAAGLAVVAADAGGPRALVQHGVTGLLTPPGDIQKLASALRVLADDPDLRRRLGMKGAVSVSGLRAQVVAKRLVDLYRQILPTSCTERSSLLCAASRDA